MRAVFCFVMAAICTTAAFVTGTQNVVAFCIWTAAASMWCLNCILEVVRLSGGNDA